LREVADGSFQYPDNGTLFFYKPETTR